MIYDTYKMSTARSFSFICLVLAVVGGVSGREYTVSGVSSGAFMAIQNHVAYNKDVVGVAAIAGGPFFCAQAKLEIALHACMVEPEFISVEELVAVTYSTYATTGTSFRTAGERKMLPTEEYITSTTVLETRPPAVNQVSRETPCTPVP